MRALRWAFFNGLFAAALFYGFERGIDGARNVALFWAWFAIVASMFAMSDTVSQPLREKGPPVPVWIDGVFDAAVISFLAWHGALWTAGFYLMHTLILHAAYAPKKTKATGESA